jgi:hypothetical protein
MIAIRTPKGQANEVHNEKAWEVLMKYLHGAARYKLHDLHPADGIISIDGHPRILAEVKSRHDFDEDTFWNRHQGEWLISNRKITTNVPIAKGLGVPFVGAMHIVQSKVVLVKAIWNQTILPGIKVRRCETQETINGGRIMRDNAFVPMHGALRLPYQ